MKRISMSDLSYDIEQLYIEGGSAKSIARQLDCPLRLVEDWIREQSVSDYDNDSQRDFDYLEA